MFTEQARLETSSASRYLQQLCKHFAHKIGVVFDEQNGRCQFSVGTAELAADETGLDIVAAAEDAENLATVKDVIESHLLRFAFREEPNALVWWERA